MRKLNTGSLDVAPTGKLSDMLLRCNRTEPNDICEEELLVDINVQDPPVDSWYGCCSDPGTMDERGEVNSGLRTMGFKLLQCSGNGRRRTRILT